MLTACWRMNDNAWSLRREEEQRECEALIELATRWKEPTLSLLVECRTVLETCGKVYCLGLGPYLTALTTETGEGPGTIRRWSLPDGALIQTSQWPPSSLSSAAVSPDGRLLASGSA